MTNPLSLFIGWMLDLLLGDPQRLPHPVVWFGKMIAAAEHALNKGRHRLMKGAATAIGLILLVYGAGWALRHLLHGVGIYAVMVFAIVALSSVEQYPFIYFQF